MYKITVAEIETSRRFSIYANIQILTLFRFNLDSQKQQPFAFLIYSEVGFVVPFSH